MEKMGTELRGWAASLWPHLAMVVVSTLMLQAMAMFFPLANKVLVDNVLVPRQMPWLLGLGLGLLATTIAQYALTLLRGHVIQSLQLRLNHHLVTQFLVHQLRLPMQVLTNWPTGELFQRIRTAGQISEMFSWRATSAMLDITMLLAYLVAMFIYNSPLAALVLGQGLMRVWFVLVVRRRVKALGKVEHLATEKASGAVLEILGALETIKASGGQAASVARFRTRLSERVDAKFQRRRLNLMVNKVMVCIGGVTLALLFWVGGMQVLREEVTLGALMAFYALQRLFSEPLESMLDSLSQFQTFGVMVERLDETLVLQPEPEGSIPPGRLQGGIDMEGVWFRFSPEAPWILKNINLTVRPGEKIALVGMSGAGKSTLSKLLLGMYPPVKGIIRYDGRDLQTLDTEALRRQMGVVIQDAFLFQDTIRANLSLQHPGADLDTLEEACRAAEIHAAIERLPLGYSQIVGEGGWAFSGGEQQRLILARALVGRPTILLLDEATSALDLETEAKVQANLGRLGCTRVLIAHRLATIRDADRILVLEQGQIVQQGTFESLVQEPGLLRDLVAAMEQEMAHV